MLIIQREAYQSDLKGQEWKWLKQFLPNPNSKGITRVKELLAAGVNECRKMLWQSRQ